MLSYIINKSPNYFLIWALNESHVLFGETVNQFISQLHHCQLIKINEMY